MNQNHETEPETEKTLSAAEAQEVPDAGAESDSESQSDSQSDSESQASESATNSAKNPKRKPRIVARNKADSLRLIEAALFASSEPLTAVELAPYVAAGETLDKLITTLRERYKDSGLCLERVAKGWAFRTAPDLGERLKIVRERKRRISRAAAETLAVIAYNQPITRGQIEEVRGVALSGGTLDILFEAGWVAPKGRADQPGHPLLWGTTPAFLDQFSLANLSDLPAERELRASGLLDGRAALAVVSEQAAEAGEGAEALAPDGTEEGEVTSAIGSETEGEGEATVRVLHDGEEPLPAPDFEPEEPLDESFGESLDKSESEESFSAPPDDGLEDPLANPLETPQRDRES